MRKGFWRIATGICVALTAATFGLTVAAPHADAVMLESQDGSMGASFLPYDSSTGDVWSEFDVAVGQTVKGRLSFLIKITNGRTLTLAISISHRLTRISLR